MPCLPRHRPSPAMLVACTALAVALGGTSVAAVSYINGRQIKPHSIPKNRLTASAIKSLTGRRGARGSRGVTGPRGVQGLNGPTGPQGILEVKRVIGPISQSITGPTDSFVFAGPTTTLEVGAKQAIVGTGSGSLYVPSGSATVKTYLCYQAANGGTVTPFGISTSNYQRATVTTDYTDPSSSAATIPGAGTWNVGYCVGNDTSATVYGNWASGLYEVVNSGSVVAAG